MTAQAGLLRPTSAHYRRIVQEHLALEGAGTLPAYLLESTYFDEGQYFGMPKTPKR
jgi:hypothetical protein